MYTNYLKRDGEKYAGVYQLDDKTGVVTSDVTARPGSHRPAQAEPCEAKLHEAPTGLSGAYSSGFTFLKPQAMTWAAAWVAEYLWVE